MAHIEQWYKNAVIYAVDVEAFIDSNDDGIGDFPGLTNRLDYLSSLGITCVWLMPFFATPNRDNGYDISDYYEIDPRLGTVGDFAEFLREAELRGLRVIVDLVVQHTSNEHPWFQAARKDRNSPYRDYYIWRDEPPENPQQKQIVYLKEEQDTSPWTWDDEAGQWYLHHFYDFQPDLNMANPNVQGEVSKIMAYWLQLGALGFRVDAAPYLGDQDASHDHASETTHEILRRLRDLVSAHNGQAVLIGEVDADPHELADFFGGGDEMQMLYNFYLNNYLFLAFATGKAAPIIRAVTMLPNIPHTCQWVNWVRNYDELDLERLSEDEQQQVYEAFAPDQSMRIYGRGIRRRLPPMVDGDRRRMELAYSLMFSLPGTPCLFLGEEIGLGEDLNLPGRNSVRTLMQWADTTNGGFSTCDPDKLVRSTISDGPFSYHTVNVVRQRNDPTSFLNWMHSLIWTRREMPEIGSGALDFCGTNYDAVLAHCLTLDGRVVLILHNLSGDECTVHVDAPDLCGQQRFEIFSDAQYNAGDSDSGDFALNPYGYRWFRIGTILR
jgi:maltose alpha-D-glucosyltransferase/alpha-amylase